MKIPYLQRADEPNLVEYITEDELTALTQQLLDDVQADYMSMKDWLSEVREATKLAMQIREQKTFPWAGASNVKFPLVTIAATQYHSKAYSLAFKNNALVRCKSKDSTSEGIERANRIAAHMTDLLLKQTDWVEQHDMLLLIKAIAGVCYKKTFLADDGLHSELVLPTDLIINYNTKLSFQQCRKTHILYTTRNDIFTKCASGLFRDIREEDWFSTGAPAVDWLPAGRDDPATQTLGHIHSSNYTLLEVHTQVDLDEDGYDEPYVITIEPGSQTILRIVAGWDTQQQVRMNGKDLIEIKPTQYFTIYNFLPSPDGSIFSVGFGRLLMPLNSSVNSLINNLIDSGTLAIKAGGFMSKGVRLASGQTEVDPTKWIPVTSTYDDIRKGLLPFPVREPSPVLLSLLSLLIDYSNRTGSITDTQVGINPGQNTPAYNMRAILEQGQQLLSAVHIRHWRALAEEYKKIYNFLLFAVPSGAVPTYGLAEMSDYEAAVDIQPASDPTLLDDEAEIRRLAAVREAAATMPGYDRDEVERQYLQALRINNIEAIFPGTQQPPPDPKLELEKLKLQIAQFEAQSKAELNEANATEANANAVKAINEVELSQFTTLLNALKEMNNVGADGRNAGTSEGVAGGTGNRASASAGNPQEKATQNAQG